MRIFVESIHDGAIAAVKRGREAGFPQGDEHPVPRR